MFIKLNKVSPGGYNDDGEVVETSTPVNVAVDSIRCFNARKNGAPGTRLTFKDRGGFPVSESVEAVTEALRNAGMAVRDAA